MRDRSIREWDDRPETDWWPDVGRDTHATIDLDAIAGNVAAVRRRAGPAQVIAVVKANAYGHGAVMVGRAALDAGAGMLAVATVDEGVELRESGITAPVLVMSAAGPHEVRDAFDAGLTLTLADAGQVGPAAAAARGVGRVGEVHLKVETGMNRYGAPVDAAVGVAATIRTADGLRLTGAYTHFADADGRDLTFTQEQVERFGAVRRQLVSASGDEPAPMFHLSNTAGSFRLDHVGVDAVRLGIGLYGLRPDDSVPLLDGMRPALAIRTRVAQVRRLSAGDTVSYGRTYTASGPETVALLPIGYADGLRRAVSGTGWVNLHGQPAPVRGRVCMDQVVVGVPVGIADGVAAGDPVTVFGADREDIAPSIEGVGRLAGTIGYEIATGIASRVPRWYLRDGRPVALLRSGRLTDVIDG